MTSVSRPTACSWAARVDGECAGSGVVCSPRHVITCAHVLSAAESEPDLREISVELPFLRGFPQPVVTRLVTWLPDLPRGSGPDVAVLELAEPVPGHAVAQVCDGVHVAGHRFVGYGYVPGQRNGMLTTGEVVGHAGDRLQLRTDPGESGIVPGFSGGPIWDETCAAVIGILAARVPGLAVGFGLPGHLLRTCWKDLPEPRHTVVLVVRSPDGQVVEVPLEGVGVHRKAVLVGRQPAPETSFTVTVEPHTEADAAILVHGPNYLARKHFRLYEEHGQWWVEVLSKNAVCVRRNGYGSERVDAPGRTRLRDGDTVLAPAVDGRSRLEARLTCSDPTVTLV